MTEHNGQTTAIIITIGEEIVSGLITDTNSVWLARHLYEMGIEVLEKISVKDIEEDIVRALEFSFERTSVIFMTGGLGPTKDDLTKSAIMRFYQSSPVFSEETHQRMIALLERFNVKPTKAHQSQAWMPSNAQLLENDMGTAPGMFFHQDERMMFSMPGVPYEMKHIFSDRIVPILKENLSLQPIFHKILMTSGQGESRLALMFEDIAESLPEGISIAYLPGTAQVRIRISGRGPDHVQTKQLVHDISDRIEKRIAEYVYGYDNEPLQAAIGRLLKQKGQTLCTAESCTGGYLAHLITSISGSSAYFQGAIIAYHNLIKEGFLSVRAETLEEFGAVSEQTVTEMAVNALQIMGTDYAIATSGIAGPGGGTPQKPVGTIWIACADQNQVKTRLLNLTKDRMRNIQYTAVSGMTLLRKVILEAEMY